MSISHRAEEELREELRRLRALSDAMAVLGASRDFDESLRTMARVLVPDVADWCFVELLRDDGSIERRVIQAADPAKHDLAHRFNERFPLDPDAPVGSPAVIRSGEPELTPDVPLEFLEAAAGADAEYLELLKALGFRSAMIVPLRVGGEVVGDLALAQAESGRRFGDDDLTYVSDLAARCSLLLEVQLREAAERAAREELEAILEGVADAVVAQEPDGTIVFANGAAADLFGAADAAEICELGPAELRRRAGFEHPDGRPVDTEELPGRGVLRGDEPGPLSVRMTDGRGERRSARLLSRPLRRGDGSVRLAITVIEDLTELTRVAESQAFLAEASRILAGSLDHPATLRELAALAVRAIAAGCAIDLAAGDGHERVALAGAPPADDDAVGRVLVTGIPLREPGRLVVPMTVRRRVLGAISLVRPGRSFDDDDLGLAGDLATRAATAVETARLYEQRSAIAHTLQTSLLPPVLPDVEGIDCAAVFRAAGDAFEVGGDFYDLFSTSDDEWFAVIGDVCGKGAEAAATTGLVRYTVRAAAVRRRSPALILRWLNEAMLRQEHDVARFCTLSIVRLDLDPGGRTVRVTAASGGHPLPRIVRADGTVEELGRAGTLIGVTADIHASEDEATLRPGDALVLFTDGLTEAGAPRRVWSPDDLDAALRSAHAAAGGSVARLVERLAAAALGPLASDPRDDIAVLGLRKR